MSVAYLLERLVPPLARHGLDEVELFVKQGRSRRCEVGPQGKAVVLSREQGWAVRASGRRASLFAAGTGVPVPSGPWPPPDGRPIHLPPPVAAAPWTPPADLDAPLLAESEAVALLETFERVLADEVPGARLLRGVIDDGSSEVELASSRGVAGEFRSRAAALYLEVAGSGAAASPLSVYLAAREGRRFDVAALARRFADRLLVRREGRAPERDRAEVVLAPAVAASLLGALLPLLVGPGAAARAKGLRDRGGRLGSRHFTVLDDGRFPDGALAAPIDGEGVATREVALVEEGVFRQPLVAWWQADSPELAPSGCTRRASWRDLPRPGPTHLYLRPDPGVPAAALLAAVSRGYYLLETAGAPWVDFENDRFEVPVGGFVLRRGRATEPLSGAVLGGGVGRLLHGIQGVGRDLSFLPLDGMVGAPTVLVAGLELRAGGAS